MVQAKGVSVPMGGREWAMLLALAVLWGGSFFFNGVAVRELPSFTLVWLRVAVAAATLLLVLRSLRQRMPTQGRTWAAFFGMGLLNNAVPFSLFVWGQHHIASGLASILNAITPLFTVLVAHLLTSDEKLTPAKMAGMAVGFAGIVAISGPAASAATADHWQSGGDQAPPSIGPVSAAAARHAGKQNSSHPSAGSGEWCCARSQAPGKSP
jgi:drug/metabolite transporter (DMT)-like permease